MCVSTEYLAGLYLFCKTGSMAGMRLNPHLPAWEE